jgi:hypothetical protein
MQDGNYIVRNMTFDEVERVAVEWAANEGWNPGLNDARMFYNADPKGFFVGLLDGVPIACVSAVAYNAEFGFIGFYMVKPGFRKEGYTLRLYRAAMGYLSTQNIGLDGVVAQQENYRKIGFKMAYNNIRYEGKTCSVDAAFPDVVMISEVPFKDVCNYDSGLFPACRTKFLKEWIAQPGSRAFAALYNGEISGYGVIRKCRQGYKIGPLFANSKEVANHLLLSLIRSVPSGEAFYLDIPDANAKAVELVGEFQLHKVFETARMYSTYFPNIDMNNVFGITSFELG